MQRLISEQQLLERQAGQQAGAVPAQLHGTTHPAAVLRQRTPTSRYAPQPQEQQAQASHVSTGVASVARYPQVQQQQQQAEQQQPTQEERMAAALISARLAQAEQVRAGKARALLNAACIPVWHSLLRYGW